MTTLAADVVLGVPGPVAAHWPMVLAALAKFQRAPLSARHALHAVALIDQLSDLAFPIRRALHAPALWATKDFLAFRAALRLCDPALAAVSDLAGSGANAPWLEVVAVPVAPGGLAALPVEDFMVCLYNGGSVPRLVVMRGNGIGEPVGAHLAAAVGWWSSVLQLRV